MAKNSGPNPRSFPENNTDYPPRMARKHVFTPTFCLHTVTTGSDFRNFGNSLRNFHLLIEICPLVPFPPSLGAMVSDYTSTPLRWTPLTRVRAQSQSSHIRQHPRLSRTASLPSVVMKPTEITFSRKLPITCRRGSTHTAHTHIQY